MNDRQVAGLRCSQVLQVLSDYLDDDLTPEARAAVEAHLRGCEDCTRFGGEFSRTVGALRSHLLQGHRPPDRLKRRFLEALANAPGPRGEGS